MNIIYNTFSKNVLQGIIQPENENFKVALFTSAYEPSSDHTSIENLLGYETIATGYERGGKPVFVEKFGNDSDYMRYAASAQVKWTSNNLICKYAILYMASGLLAACYDLGDIHLNDIDNILTLDWTTSYMLSFRVADRTELNAQKIKEDIYQTIVMNTPAKLKENVRDYIIKDNADESNAKDALKKSAHDYIIENSDTELDEESINTIQNKAILESTLGMENSDIDSIFE